MNKIQPVSRRIVVIGGAFLLLCGIGVFALAFAEAIPLRILLWGGLGATFCVFCVWGGILYRYVWEATRREQLLQTLLQQLQSNFAIVDENGAIVAISDNWRHAMKDQSNLSLKDLSYCLLKHDLIAEKTYEALHTGQKLVYENGDLNWRITFLKLDSEMLKKRAVLITQHDITEQNLLTSALKTQEACFSGLIHILPSCVMCLDLDGCITCINEAAATFFDLNRQDVIGMEYLQVFTFVEGDEAAQGASPVERVLLGYQRHETVDMLKIKLYNNTILSVGITVQSIFDDRKKLKQVLVLFQPPEEVPEQIESKEDKLRILARAWDLSMAGYFIYNPQNREQAGSEGMERLWPMRNGFPLPEEEWIYSEDLADFEKQRARLIAGEIKVWDTIFRSNYFGTMRYFQLRAVLEKTGGNSETRIFGVLQNITDLNHFFRKNDEVSLLLNALMEALHGIIFVEDISNCFRYTAANKQFYQFFELVPSQVIGHDDFEIFGDVPFVHEFRKKALAATKGGQMENDLVEIKDKEGKSHIYHIFCRIANQNSGRPLLVVLGIDQTQSYEEGQKREKKLQFYKKLIDALPVGLAVKNTDEGFKYTLWNRWFQESCGYSEAQILGKTDFDIPLFRGHEAEIRNQDMTLAFQQEPQILNEPMKMADGGILYCTRQRVLLKDKGVNYIVSVLNNASKEFELEASRREMEDKFNEQITTASVVNSCLKRLTREEDFAQAVNDMLTIIGGNINADRCYIYQYSEEEQDLNRMFQWRRDDAVSEVDLSLLPAEGRALWKRSFLNRELVHIDDAANLEEPWEVCHEFLAAQKIKSILVAGIYLDNHLSGFMGIDIVQEAHCFSNSALRMINDAVSMFQIARQRQLYLERIQESAASQKVIIDAIPFPVLLLNMDFSLAHCNSAVLRKTRSLLDHMIGEACYSTICHIGMPNASFCPVMKTMETGKPCTMEKRLDGIDYQINTIPIFRDGHMIQVLESFIDITEVNKSKELLRQAAVDAAEAAKAKSLFLATMSHELRTPLNAVIGFAELLKLGDMSAQELQDAVNAIHVSGTALLSLINDVLDLSKLEAGQMTIVPTQTNLRSIISDLRTIFEHKFKEKGISFLLEIPQDLPFVYLDQLRLRQILLNLLGNAVKFTHKGGITVATDFERVGSDSGTLKIMIRDTGIGIAKEKLKAVFEPFVQDESRRGTVYQGTGLGLPICKRLVEAMSGQLSLQSVLGKGSCFTITLPNLKYEGLCPEREPHASMQPIPVLHGRALLVDDVLMNLRVLQVMLQKLGLETQTATSGKEALDLLEQNRFDMVFTDVWMPKMNGMELARKIRTAAYGSEVRVLALTADTEVKELAQNPDFDGVLLKPLTLDKLRVMVEALIQKESPAAKQDEATQGGSTKI